MMLKKVYVIPIILSVICGLWSCKPQRVKRNLPAFSSEFTSGSSEVTSSSNPPEARTGDEENVLFLMVENPNALDDVDLVRDEKGAASFYELEEDGAFATLVFKVDDPNQLAPEIQEFVVDGMIAAQVPLSELPEEFLPETEGSQTVELGLAGHVTALRSRIGAPASVVPPKGTSLDASVVPPKGTSLDASPEDLIRQGVLKRKDAAAAAAAGNSKPLIRQLVLERKAAAAKAAADNPSSKSAPAPKKGILSALEMRKLDDLFGQRVKNRAIFIKLSGSVKDLDGAIQTVSKRITEIRGGMEKFSAYKTQHPRQFALLKQDPTTGPLMRHMEAMETRFKEVETAYKKFEARFEETKPLLLEKKAKALLEGGDLSQLLIANQKFSNSATEFLKYQGAQRVKLAGIKGWTDFFDQMKIEVVTPQGKNQINPFDGVTLVAPGQFVSQSTSAFDAMVSATLQKTGKSADSVTANKKLLRDYERLKVESVLAGVEVKWSRTTEGDIKLDDASVRAAQLYKLETDMGRQRQILKTQKNKSFISRRIEEARLRNAEKKKLKAITPEKYLEEIQQKIRDDMTDKFKLKKDFSELDGWWKVEQ